MTNRHKYIQPTVLLKLQDLGETGASDLQSLVYQFERIELVYFALELIYNQELSIGYDNFCKRISPQDDGKLLIEHLNRYIYDRSALANYHLVCAQTGIELLKYLFSIPDNGTPWNYEKIANGGVIKSIHILLIVLHINERIIKGNAQISKDDDAKDAIAHAAVVSTIENNDYLNYDITTTPFIHLLKSLRLLNYCDKTPSLASHKNALLSEYGCANTKAYISFVLSLLSNNLDGEHNYCRLVYDTSNPIPKAIDKISISLDEVIAIENNKDYKVFRARPLIKLNSNQFVVICIPFLMDKLYNSLAFDLTDVSGNGNRIREIISSQFTEPLLLYPLLHSIVEPRSPIHLSGEDCKAIKPDRAPDYYVRNWNDVFLFELKDYSLRADIKSSPQFDELIEYLRTQFVTKSNGKDGAIKQLVHNIKAILDNKFVWDKSLRKPRKIYPLLVLGNSAYMTLGVPYILNKLFKEELLKDGILDRRITDLIVIDIDTLLLYKGDFGRGVYKFKKVIDDYLAHINKDYSRSLSIELRLYAFMQTLPMYLKAYYPTTADNIVKELKNENIWND